MQPSIGQGIGMDSDSFGLFVNLRLVKNVDSSTVLARPKKPGAGCVDRGGAIDSLGPVRKLAQFHESRV
jgi:hypothetical protein